MGLSKGQRLARREGLKIAINTLSAKAGGGITHLINLLPELARLDKVNRYEILVAPEKQDVFRVDAPNFHVVPCRFPSRSAAFRLVWEQFYLPIYALLNRIDLLYCPLNSAPFLPTVPQVCTVRMAPDEVFAVQQTWGMKLFWLVQAFIIWASVHSSTRVMAISGFLKQKLVRLYKVAEDRIDVVHHGRSLIFHPVDRNEARKLVRERFDITDPYVLVVADFYRHKNCERIVELVERLRMRGHPDLHLIWAGTLFDSNYTQTVLEMVQDRDLTDHVHFVGSLPPDVLRFLYSGAECFLYLSLSEMFGQPLVEAMSCEVPVVTSDLPVMREVAGDAALFAPPTDIDACVEQTSRLLDDRALREELIERGRERKNFFSWEQGARRLLEVFDKTVYHGERKPVRPRSESEVPRIVINALAVRTGGGVVYLSNLLQVLVPNYECVVLLDRKQHLSLSSIPRELSIHRCSLPSWWSGLLRAFWEQIQLPVLLGRERADLLISPFNTGPISARHPSVVTVHVNFSEVRSLVQGVFVKLRWELLRMISEASCHQANRVIAVSHYAKSHLVETMHLSPDKARVVHHCCSEHFKPFPHKIARHIVADVFKLDRPYILMVGDIYEHKNVLCLVEAFAALPDEPALRYDMVLVGEVINFRYMERVMHRASELGCADRLKWIGSVRHHALPPIYSEALFFVLPSLTETFGMPLIESMACGTPVTGSRIPAFEEVLGDAGLLFDPTSVGDMRTALEKMLTDEDFRDSLRRKGLERAKVFSQERFADETLAVINQVLSEEKER